MTCQRGDLAINSRSYILHRPLVGHRDRSGRFGGDINVVPVPGIEPRSLGSSAHGIVAVLTEIGTDILHNLYACHSCRPSVCSLIIHLEKLHSDTTIITIFMISYPDWVSVHHVCAWRSFSLSPHYDAALWRHTGFTSGVRGRSSYSMFMLKRHECLLESMLRTPYVEECNLLIK